MSENLHNIDDLFKKGLEDNEEQPSGNVWENIDRKLDKKSVLSINKKYRRVKWVAAASLIMVCGLAMYTIYTKKVNSDLVKKDKEVINKTENNSSPFGKNQGSTNVTIDTLKSSQETWNEVAKQGEKSESKPLANDAIVQKPHESEIVKDFSAGNKPSDKKKSTLKEERSADVEQVAGEHFATTKTPLLNNSNTASAKSLDISTDRRSPKQKYAQLSSVEASAKQALTNSDIENKALDPFIRDIAELLAVQTKDANLLTHQPIEKQLLESKVLPFKTITGETEPDKSIAVGNLRSSGTKTPFSLTLFFSPDFVSANLKSDQPRFREDDRREIKQNEVTKTSYTVGLLGKYSIDKKWSITAGLTYFTRMTDIQSKIIYARPDARGEIKYRFNSSVGYSYVTLKSAAPAPRQGDSIRTVSSTSALNYIGVPLAVNYTMKTGKFSIAPSIGLSANFLSKGIIETTLDRGGSRERARITDIQGLKPSYFNGLVGVAATYNLTDKLSVSFMPTTRFALSAINKNAPVKTYLNSTGLGAGLTIGL